MSVHLSKDLETLHRDLLSMCGSVEEMINRAVDLLFEPNRDDAVALRERDHEIDRLDVRLEDACLKALALHQPVAIDLRRIAAVLKISGELERVADLSVNIGERAVGLLEGPEVPIPDQLRTMADEAVGMLHESIDAYVDLDSQRARAVCGRDDAVDVMNREIIDQLIEWMHQKPESVESLLHMFSASRQVERVADHATNIAEDVVYLVEGAIIRHGRHLHGNQPQPS